MVDARRVDRTAAAPAPAAVGVRALVRRPWRAPLLLVAGLQELCPTAARRFFGAVRAPALGPCRERRRLLGVEEWPAAATGTAACAGFGACCRSSCALVALVATDLKRDSPSAHVGRPTTACVDVTLPVLDLADSKLAPSTPVTTLCAAELLMLNRF